jgi:hypothetical protein
MEGGWDDFKNAQDWEKFSFSNRAPDRPDPIQ